MQVFKKFIKIQKKYMVSATIFFVMGILLIFMNYALRNSSTATKDFHSMQLPIHLADEDQSEVSKIFVEYLKENHKVDETEQSSEVLAGRLYYQDIVADVTIPKGFGEAFVSGETPDSPQVKSVVDEGIAHGHMINLQFKAFLNSMYAFYHSGMSLTEAAEQAKATQTAENYVTIVEEVKDDGSTISRSKESMSQILFLCVPYVIMSCVFTSLLPAVMSFNETEKKNRENASGFPVWKRSLTLALGSLLFALAFYLCYMVCLAIFCGSESFSGMWMLMALNLLVFTISTVMMMAFLSVLPLKASVLSSIVSTVVSLGFAFLGGIFVPLSYLGDGVKMIGRFLPTFWYATSLDALNSGKGFVDVLPYFGLELLFGLACLAIALALSKASERAH